jgi:hypothetical protein
MRASSMSALCPSRSTQGRPGLRRRSACHRRCLATVPRQRHREGHRNVEDVPVRAGDELDGVVCRNLPDRADHPDCTGASLMRISVHWHHPRLFLALTRRSGRTGSPGLPDTALVEAGQSEKTYVDLRNQKSCLVGAGVPCPRSAQAGCRRCHPASARRMRKGGTTRRIAGVRVMASATGARCRSGAG